jgi:alcohol dehydrogenase
MKAAVYEESVTSRPFKDSQPLKIQEIDLDPPGPDELLVKVLATGLCHSDLSVIDGTRPRPGPMVLGHEATGEVIEIGKNVNDIKPGDQIVMVFVPSCGCCLPCAEGRPGLCEPGVKANVEGTLLSGARRLRRNSQLINHHIGVSGFAEYTVISRRSAIKLEEKLPATEAALFGCAVLTGVGAVVNTAKVPAGSRVAIVGAGGVGLCALLGAILSGASEIIVIDINPSKLKVAAELGATQAVLAGSDVVQEVKDLTHGGVDFAFEMASSIPALQTAFEITRRGGVTVTASLPHPNKQFSLSPSQLVGEERTLKGCYIGSCIPQRDLPRCIALYQKGKLPVNKLLSEIVTLDELNEAFDRLVDGSSIRQVCLLAR